MPQRIILIGSGGSGKSTLARQIGAVLSLPVIHLDALFWQPGWVETPRPEWEALQRELVARDRWVIDGNYGHTLDIRLAAADTVIFMDMPRLVCAWGAIKRRIMYAGRALRRNWPTCGRTRPWCGFARGGRAPASWRRCGQVRRPVPSVNIPCRMAEDSLRQPAFPADFSPVSSVLNIGSRFSPVSS